MVVLAGLVWNAPTSCAWASRVMVNSRAARNHGLKAVGLPSSHVVSGKHAWARAVCVDCACVCECVCVRAQPEVKLNRAR